MSNVRCTFCGRYYKKIKDEDKCKDCHTQMKTIVEQLSKKYSNAMENLKDR